MSLLNGANAGDRVNYSSVAMGAAGTVLYWLYCTNDTTRQRFGNNTVADREWIDYPANNPGKNFEVYVARTSYLIIKAVTTSSNFAAWGINKWCFVAIRFDTAGVNSDQKLLVGDQILDAAEPGAYSVQTVGSGTVTSESGTNFIFGNNAGFNIPFLGRMGFISCYNRAMPTVEIISQQWRPRVSTGCKLFSYPGFTGTGTQPDWSGNGSSGTVTGSTVADGLPIGPMFGYDDYSDFPPIVAPTGRIFKLAGEGGGLVGPYRGLAADRIR